MKVTVYKVYDRGVYERFYYATLEQAQEHYNRFPKDCHLSKIEMEMPESASHIAALLNGEHPFHETTIDYSGKPVVKEEP